MEPFSHKDLMVAVVPEDGEAFEAWDCAGSECKPTKPCTNDPSGTGVGKGPAFRAGTYEALRAELERQTG